MSTPDTDAWYVKPFWRKTWGHERGGLGALGATILYGEYGQYERPVRAGSNLASTVANTGTSIGASARLRLTTAIGLERAFVTGSEVRALGSRRGPGDRRGRHASLGQMAASGARCRSHGVRRNLMANDACDEWLQAQQDFDDWDLFQARWHHLLLNQRPETQLNGSRPLRGGFFFAPPLGPSRTLSAAWLVPALAKPGRVALAPPSALDFTE